jgi:hypothetical protein
VRSRLTKKLYDAKEKMPYTFVIKVPDDGSDEPKTRSTLLYSIKVLCTTVSCVYIYQWVVSLKSVMEKQGVMDELFNFVLRKSCQFCLVILVEDRGTVGRYLPQKLISVRTLVMAMRKQLCHTKQTHTDQTQHMPIDNRLRLWRQATSKQYFVKNKKVQTSINVNQHYVQHIHISYMLQWTLCPLLTHSSTLYFNGVYRLATDWTVRRWNTCRRRRLSAHVQTAPGAHPASSTMGTGLFPGVKRSRRGVYHPPHLAPMLKTEYSYASTLPQSLDGLF